MTCFQDIWQHLKELERGGPRSKSNFMVRQTDLTWNTRSILVDWLGSVAYEYKFCDQTFYLSVNYVDRLLSQMSVVSFLYISLSPILLRDF